jgi:hypothetical protein
VRQNANFSPRFDGRRLSLWDKRVVAIMHATPFVALGAPGLLLGAFWIFYSPWLGVFFLVISLPLLWFAWRAWTAFSDLAERVELRDEILHVTRGKIDASIPLFDVMSVAGPSFAPSIITVRLRNAGPFGDTFGFLPLFRPSINPWARHPVSELLITIADRARVEHE